MLSFVGSNIIKAMFRILNSLISSPWLFSVVMPRFLHLVVIHYFLVHLYNTFALALFLQANLTESYFGRNAPIYSAFLFALQRIWLHTPTYAIHISNQRSNHHRLLSCNYMDSIRGENYVSHEPYPILPFFFFKTKEKILLLLKANIYYNQVQREPNPFLLVLV